MGGVRASLCMCRSFYIEKSQENFEGGKGGKGGKGLGGVGEGLGAPTIPLNTDPAFHFQKSGQSILLKLVTHFQPRPSGDFDQFSFFAFPATSAPVGHFECFRPTPPSVQVRSLKKKTSQPQKKKLLRPDTP